MKIYRLSKQESVINRNGKVERYSKTVQDDGKDGLIREVTNGKVKTKKFKVKNNKSLFLKKRKKTRKRRKTRRNNSIVAGKLNKRRNRKSSLRKRKTKKKKKQGIWEKIFF
jgi:hypothetical protein